ncbi:GNAT family N-acetyltransferase [Paenibacillus marinisediminis]
MTIRVRTEQHEDHQAIRDVNIAAFDNRNDEADLVDRIRQSLYYVPMLSIIAEDDGEIVGHLMLSEAEVTEGDQHHKVIALAPIAVMPDRQREGIGKLLIEVGLKRCKELGYSLVLLIGHPTYYPKFGFVPARAHGLELRQFQVPDEVFMVYELQEHALERISGELKYPPAFFGNE